MTWFIARRLDYIDWRLATHGSINRSHLIEQFDISMPQASQDLNAFIAAYRDAMVYDKTAKCYVTARAKYKPVRGAPDGYRWT